MARHIPGEAGTMPAEEIKINLRQHYLRLARKVLLTLLILFSIVSFVYCATQRSNIDTLYQSGNCLFANCSQDGEFIVQVFNNKMCTPLFSVNITACTLDYTSCYFWPEEACDTASKEDSEETARMWLDVGMAMSSFTTVGGIVASCWIYWKKV